jgi:hypothetical protein
MLSGSSWVWLSLLEAIIIKYIYIHVYKYITGIQNPDVTL